MDEHVSEGSSVWVNVERMDLTSELYDMDVNGEWDPITGVVQGHEISVTI